MKHLRLRLLVWLPALALAGDGAALAQGRDYDAYLQRDPAAPTAKVRPVRVPALPAEIIIRPAPGSGCCGRPAPAPVAPQLLEALDRPVDFRADGLPLAETLDRLSRLAGVPIRVAAEVPDCRTMAAFTAAPLRRILESIAAQAGAMVRPDRRADRPGILLDTPRPWLHSELFRPWSTEWPFVSPSSKRPARGDVEIRRPVPLVIPVKMAPPRSAAPGDGTTRQ